jgi:hypothetical protein
MKLSSDRPILVTDIAGSTNGRLSIVGGGTAVLNGGEPNEVISAFAGHSCEFRTILNRDTSRSSPLLYDLVAGQVQRASHRRKRTEVCDCTLEGSIFGSRFGRVHGNILC